MAGRGEGPDFVEALARGLDVIACFDRERPELSLSDVAQATGLARPTARRLLLTLEELGYVRSREGLLAGLDPASLDAALATPGRSGLVPRVVRERPALDDELARVRARGWALADEELAPGVRSVAVPVRDGTGTVRAAMNVTVHAAETSTHRLLNDHLPPLLTTAGQISAEWAIWLSRPHVEIGRYGEAGPATA